MKDMRFSEDHFWVRSEDDGSVTVGVTEYAQEQLGDVVYVELPPVGQTVTPEEVAAMVESVKTTGEVKVPVTGDVIAINRQLSDHPELVNTDPLGDGWFFRLQLDDGSELDELLDEETYQEYVNGL